ncbi:START domain-containing protein [Alkalimarinus alittae]|uniref:START domain-containing protein n=1 Tax=Alkalimarinus alittae TaxID=2961619 RepID=A0ABY6N4N0_9ALTE|nr:START domain-containing protein [Alkalimarinus alittae]UZE96969.1 START domain-containing protein [Alkalimarinus alittae]
MTRSFLSAISIILALTTTIASSFAISSEVPMDAPDWEEQTTEGSITIYTRPHPNSNFKAFKAVTIIDAPINNLMAVMANPKSCMEWVLGCTVASAFDEKSFNDRYAYSVNDMPWPFKDRDYVLHIKTSNDPKSGIIYMHMNATDHKKAISDEYERVHVAQTIYSFEPLEDNKTKMTWLQHTEPGGMLPGWLVNALIVDIPVQSLQALERAAQSPKYQDANILFDSQGMIIGVDSTLSRQQTATP